MPALLIPLIVQLIVSLPQLITAAQKVFSGTPDAGPAKKSLVMGGVSSVLTVESKLGPVPITQAQMDEIMNVISALIDNHVETMQPILNPPTVITGVLEPQKKGV